MHRFYPGHGATAFRRTRFPTYIHHLCPSLGFAMGFVPLHCHSVFSFHAGVCTVEDLAGRAGALGMPAVALTDTDRMSGLIRFYLACRRLGMKPILGVELTDPKRPEDHVVMLAKNASGYSDLCEIVTRRQIDPAAFAFSRAFSKFWPNLFLLTPFPHLLTLLAATPNRPNLYGELVNQDAQTRRRGRQLVQRAAACGIPLAVSCNSFFMNADDWETHRILAAIRRNSTLSRLKPGDCAPRGAFLRSHEEMMRLFPNHKEAVENTTRIAEQCDAHLDLGRWILPEMAVPPGHTPETYLERLAREGLEANYGGRETYGKAKAVQDMELQVISKLGYPSYFLIVKEIREWANRRFGAGYRRPEDCSILRGSAANSLTFFNLGVSDLDPIAHDLYFQRFLNEDRASPPDADLDFGWDEREEVIDYVVRRWGQDRVAITCTTHHFRQRAAFRETAKVFGYTEAQVSEIFKSRLLAGEEIADREIGRIAALSGRIRGMPRFLGQHPGGVLITNDAICRHVACEPSGGAKNRLITQVDIHGGIDELGLIKFDILGNGSLSVLRDTLAQIRAQLLPDPEVWDVEKCVRDPTVRQMMRTGRTKGVFYIESPAQARLNQKVQAETFEEVTITSSLIRPAGTPYAAQYVERQRKMKMGVVDWDFLHPCLEPILRDTHDVCAFQEDVTKICHHVAGVSYKTADRIRKMMNSSHEGEVPFAAWEQVSQDFVTGCIRHSGLSADQAVALWDRVSSFTGFSFCKSHSASYARLSFKCAYLKAHYPAQFLAAMVSNGHGFYSKEVYLNEARRWGVRILPIHINESDIPYRGKHRWMRPGLMHVRHVSRRSLDKVVCERERNGPFCNLIDFARRVDMHRQEMENLIFVGAFDGFGLTQPELLYLLDGICGKAHVETPSLFARDLLYRHRELHPGLCDYTLAERCLNELRLLGFMLSGNILDILDLHPAAKGAASAVDVPGYAGKGVKVFGWPVTARVHQVAASGKPMLFLMIEDKTGCVDVLLWPGVYHRFADVISDAGPFEIWGRVVEDWGTYAIEAHAIRAVAWSPGVVDYERASQRLARSFRGEYANAGVQPSAA